MKLKQKKKGKGKGFIVVVVVLPPRWLIGIFIIVIIKL